MMHVLYSRFKKIYSINFKIKDMSLKERDIIVAPKEKNKKKQKKLKKYEEQEKLRELKRAK